MASSALIETAHLTKRFGDFAAVDDVSLRVRAGEVLVLLGPNGAGKTTTTRMLAAILAPTSGWARIAGFDVVRQAAQVRGCIGLLTEHHGLYTRMRAHEYLAFFGSIYGMSSTACASRALELLEQVGMGDTAGRRLGEFSKGMRQKLALVRALLHDPCALLLDEPTSAMDPASARLVRESIAQLRSSNRAIVVTTHNLAEAEVLADRIAIIRNGRIAAEGTPSELKRRYLGDPIMELRLAGALNGAAAHLPAGVAAVALGRDWLRYQASDPQSINPQVLSAMAQAGLPVVTLSEVGRSLEEVYLQVVGARPPEVRA